MDKPNWIVSIYNNKKSNAEYHSNFWIVLNLTQSNSILKFESYLILTFNIRNTTHVQIRSSKIQKFESYWV